LLAAARALQDELTGPLPVPDADDAPLTAERRAVDGFKKAALMVIGLAMQTYGPTLSDEQEVLMDTADLLIDVYAADSACLRAQAARRSGARAELHQTAARLFVNDAALRIEATARRALAAMLEGDAARTALAGLRRLMKADPVNTVVLRRRLADETVAGGGYPF
jgi:hypothetical protein